MRYKASKGRAGFRNGYAAEESLAEAKVDKDSGDIAKQETVFVEKVHASDRGSVAAITKFINDRAADLKKCNTANLHGKMVVRLVISPDGKVKKAVVVTDRTGNAGLKKCVSEAMLQWSFPGLAAKKNITATITLNF
jgi:TonB family protein